MPYGLALYPLPYGRGLRAYLQCLTSSPSFRKERMSNSQSFKAKRGRDIFLK